MPLAQLKQATLHYRLDGPEPKPDQEHAPVVVFSNSLGTDLHMWDAQVSLLGDAYRILRYDTRGHGHSSAPAGPYTLADLGNDVLELLDLLEIERAHICGVSLGGITALWLGIHAPHRVLSLVPANTAARIGSEEMWAARIAQVAAHGLASVAYATMPRWFTGDFRQRNPHQVELARQTLCSVDPAGYLACCAALRDADLRSSLSQIAVPTLAITGTHDPVTPTSDALYLRDHIPNARYVELNAAHISCIEDPSDFSQALLHFLN